MVRVDEIKNFRMKISVVLGVFIICLSVVIGSCKLTAKQEVVVVDGRTLSKLYCASCHMYPSPDLLPKSTWRDFVLVRMASLMGIYTDNVTYYDEMPQRWIEPGIGGKRVLEAGVYPKEALLSREEWESIKSYYIENAPMSLEPNSKKLKIGVKIPGFTESNFHKNREISPLIQGLYWDQQDLNLYAGQYQEDIYQYNKNGKQISKIAFKGYFVDFQRFGKNVYALDMGSRIASDNPQGQLIKFGENGNKKNNELVLSKLMRPVSFDIEDLNGDNKPDFVICEYGNNLGALNLYLSSPRGYIRSALFEDDGSVRAEIIDYNHDGLLDIIALKANADEGIDVYINKGKEDFERNRILRFLPTYGSTHFSLIDFEGDGGIDILYSNGDNGDYTPVLKPYHGIHLFSQNGEEYEEKFFIPHNGVYQAQAVDFDLDGDMDIAAVSFHPDFVNDPKESFQVYINDGQNNFEAHTIKSYDASRWMRFLCEDIDEDGDTDIILSAMNIKTPEISASVSKKWADQDKAILLLRNNAE